MPSPDLEKSLKLSDLRKLVREYDEKQEFSSFQKKTDEEVKATVNLLKEVHRLTDTQIAFTNLYNKTEEKRRVDEQKRVRERLSQDGNFKAFIFQQTEGLRETFHNTWDIKASDLGKGITKGLNTFGLFGKFDTSGLIRKFDEYKVFTKERQGKVLDVKMLEKIEEMILKENSNMDDVKHFLQLNGLTNSKIADLVYQFNKGYKESVDSIINQGVLRHEETNKIVDELRGNSLLNDKQEVEIKEEKTTDEEIQGVVKTKSFEEESNIFVEKNITNGEETLNELVRQGTVLDEINDSIKRQVMIMDEEVRLTEEDRNRRKLLDTGKKDSKGSSFGELFSANILSDILTKIGIPALIAWIAGSGGALVVGAAAGAISLVAAPLAMLGNWASGKAFFNNPDFVNEMFYKPEAYKLTKTESTLADIYGVKSENIQKAESGGIDEAQALRKATQEAKEKFFARGARLTEEQKRRLTLSQLEDQVITLKENGGTDKQIKEIISKIQKTREIKVIEPKQNTNGTTQQNTKTVGDTNTQINVANKQEKRDIIPTRTGAKGK